MRVGICRSESFAAPAPTAGVSSFSGPVVPWLQHSQFGRSFSISLLLAISADVLAIFGVAHVLFQQRVTAFGCNREFARTIRLCETECTQLGCDIGRNRWRIPFRVCGALQLPQPVKIVRSQVRVHALGGHSRCPRNLSRYPSSRASWTIAIVVWAALRARSVPLAKASRTNPILAAKCARRSRIGSRKVLSTVASFCLTSTSPTAPRRYRSLRSATSSRSRLNASWYRNTGLPSTWPGSVARSRVGSVYIEIGRAHV